VSNLVWSDPDDIVGYNSSPRGAGFTLDKIFQRNLTNLIN